MPSQAFEWHCSLYSREHWPRLSRQHWSSWQSPAYPLCCDAHRMSHFLGISSDRSPIHTDNIHIYIYNLYSVYHIYICDILHVSACTYLHHARLAVDLHITTTTVGSEVLFAHVITFFVHVWSSMAKAPHALPNGHVGSAQNAAPHKSLGCRASPSVWKWGAGMVQKSKTKLIHMKYTRPARNPVEIPFLEPGLHRGGNFENRKWL